jgi:hypothetical protein
MSEKGKALLETARHGCSADVGAVVKHDRLDFDSAFTKAGTEAAASLGHVVDMTPVKLPVPILLGTGLADSLVPPRHQYGAVAALCAAGNSVVWKTYAGATHNGGTHAAFADALAFVKGALAGSPVASNCSSVSEPGEPGAATPGFAFND